MSTATETTHVALSEIVVGRRVRSDLGDIDALVKSITEVGLLQPIVVDDRLRLVAGQRRLEAVKRLGWDTVPVFPATSVTDAATALMAERDENECRKAMTPSERVVLTERLMDLERPSAKLRQGTRTDLGQELPVSADTGSQLARTERQSESNAVRNIAGAAAGWSGASYQRAKAVLESAEDETLPEPVREQARDLAEKMEGGDIGVSRAYTRLQSIKANAPTDAGGIDRSREAVRRREQKLREMAAGGHSSAQIAAAIGVSEGRVRVRARELGIDMPADRVLSRTRRPDSTRIVNDIAMSAEVLCAGADLINFTELDAGRLEEWVGSIESGIKALQSLKRQLTKELTR